jgi:hypothetical protein
MPEAFKRIRLDEIQKFSYDAVMLNWVMHHAPQSEHHQIAQNCAEALQNGGLLIVHETGWNDCFCPSEELTPENKAMYAVAYVRDMISSMGMTPNKPQAETSIGGYYSAQHWFQLFQNVGLKSINLQSNSGFPLKAYSTHDEFSEKTHSLYFVKDR